MRRRGFADSDRWIRFSPAHTAAFEAIRADVWNMVQTTYAKIGLIVDSPRDLDEYNVWEVYENDRDQPIAFRLGKTTPFGIKGGLVGSDGSREGRAAVKEYVAEWYRQPGNYGEVSHRMEELAFDAGAPVVCAIYAGQVLQKPLHVESDGVHYRRKIRNVGEVTKVIVGRPRGIPTTDADDLRCPPPRHQLASLGRLPYDDSDDAILDHAASVIRL